MAPRWLPWFNRNQQTIEIAFFCLFLALFTWSFADWRGWLPFERGFHPLRMVFLSAALLTQSISTFVRGRSVILFYVLLGTSLILLISTFTVAS